jgi:hypothetical protein
MSVLTYAPVCEQLREQTTRERPGAWSTASTLTPSSSPPMFGKKTQATPTSVIDACKRRLRAYDAAVGGRE